MTAAVPSTLEEQLANAPWLQLLQVSWLRAAVRLLLLTVPDASARMKENVSALVLPFRCRCPARAEACLQPPISSRACCS